MTDSRRGAGMPGDGFAAPRVGQVRSDRLALEPYFLELVRYLHLNPLRARVVADLRALDHYRWCGHGALVGRGRHPWQATRATGPSWRRGSPKDAGPIAAATLQTMIKIPGR